MSEKACPFMGGTPCLKNKCMMWRRYRTGRQPIAVYFDDCAMSTPASPLPRDKRKEDAR